MDNLIFSNVLHRKTRSVTTAGGVALGVALVILAVGLVDGFLSTQGRRNSAVTADIIFASPAASFGFGFSSSLSATMPTTTAAQIREIPGVAEAVPILQYLDGSQMLDGIDYESFAKVSDTRIVEGRPARTGDEVMIDPVVKRARKLKLGTNIDFLGRPFTVVGVYEPESLYRFKVPITTVQQIISRTDSCSLIFVKTTAGASVDQVFKQIAARFPENKLLLTRDLPQLFVSGTPAVQVFLGAVVALAIAVSTMLILLTMYSTVKERTREIGILKSLGASKAWIASEIIKEALAISMAGVVFGYGLSLVGKYVIQALAPTLVQLEGRWFVYSLVLGLLSGAVGALYPALQAAYQDPVRALAYE
jgi:putative ABC transport system permease protein